MEGLGLIISRRVQSGELRVMGREMRLGSLTLTSL